MIFSQAVERCYFHEQPGPTPNLRTWLCLTIHADLRQTHQPRGLIVGRPSNPTESARLSVDANSPNADGRVVGFGAFQDAAIGRELDVVR